jgi:hypothetical protein
MCGGRLDYVNYEERKKLHKIVEEKIRRPLDQWTERDHEAYEHYKSQSGIPWHVPSEQEVVGCVINVRKKETRLSLWMRRQPDRSLGGDLTIKIGLAWKALVSPQGEEKIEIYAT